MKELKTLKDLLELKDAEHFDIENFTWRLKAEAVKWVKEILNKASKEFNKNCKKRQRHSLYYAHLVGMRTALVDFFNLAEEDLK